MKNQTFPVFVVVGPTSFYQINDKRLKRDPWNLLYKILKTLCYKLVRTCYKEPSLLIGTPYDAGYYFMAIQILHLVKVHAHGWKVVVVFASTQFIISKSVQFKVHSQLTTCQYHCVDLQRVFMLKNLMQLPLVSGRGLKLRSFILCPVDFPSQSESSQGLLD